VRGARRIRARSACALAGAVALASLAAPASATTRPPALGSTAAIVTDAHSGEVLFSQHGSSRRSIGSTTKLMTAYLVLAKAKQSDVFTAPAYNAGPAEVLIGLRKGERMTVHDLLRAVLLPSANDAAWDLAYNVGNGSVSRFVRMMNREAKRLGLRHTHYANPIGLDDSRNYSTAADLAKLAAIDMRIRAFAKIVDLTHATLKSGSRLRVVTNRNDLVDRYHYVDGVKTGHTQNAGYVLVGAAHRAGANVISVVIGEPSVAGRDSDSIALLRWGLRQYHRVAVFKAARAIASLPIHQHSGRARVVAARPVSLTVRRDRVVRTRLFSPTELKGPLPPRRRVGRAQVLVGEKVVATVPLVTAAAVPGPSFVRKLEGVLKDVLISLAVLFALLVCTLVALRVRVLRRQRARSAR
jgi:serine-type D-Ala-D-Ala carboxypeptidase (penicillin-binding protein 5/6)